ncbi:MAG: hypothetical protein R6V83_00830 [Candidatus Thorarchaeota archaeon]
MKHRKKAVVAFIIVLVSFSIAFALFHSLQAIRGAPWPFPELGPSIVQDSYSFRAPMLETIHGILGDIPGGYSLYRGNPIVSPVIHENPVSLDIPLSPIPVGRQLANLRIIMLFIAFSLIPPAIIILIGRSSYGRKKAR